MAVSVNIFWFRRDLRLEDNTGLFYALKSGKPVLPVFVFDKNILDDLTNKRDRRVEFINQALMKIRKQLREAGSDLYIHYGTPQTLFSELVEKYQLEAVFANHDYEPYARKRDESVRHFLLAREIPFHTYKDQVIFERNEVLKDDGKPYTVFTPYSRKWKSILKSGHLTSFDTGSFISNFFQTAAFPDFALEQTGFHATGSDFPPPVWEKQKIIHYKEQRDIPSVAGTSRLSVHLRFGTISIRQLAREAGSWNETFLNELIWREFYHMILWHFPQVAGNAFKPEYDQIRWRNNEQELQAWKEGRTGYPIVDAGMRELLTTGYMHNRVRMIVASFLTKHLLCDWRLGEAFFAEHLLDFDLAANNGGWQWAAGSGCDAAPYFRVFNPYLQTEKFDPSLLYIRKWVPEFEELTYPQPVVDHAMARQRCLEAYAVALKK